MDEAALAAHLDAVRRGGHHSWGYHSRASAAHRYVAMAVPKVACTTIKMALQTWEVCAPVADRWGEVHAGWAGPTLLSYPTGQIVEMLRSPAYLRFSFVRNPYSRLVSAWKSKLASDNPQYEALRTSIRATCGDPMVNGTGAGTVAFRDSVEYLLLNPDAFDDHWSPQLDVLAADAIDYDIIGRFERLGPEFCAILERLGAPSDVIDTGRRQFNATEPTPLTAVYDRRLAKRVYDHYARDFEAFSYGVDSWRSR
jgi:hypothetical protein